MLIASYLYILCQALDLRALQAEFLDGLEDIADEELVSLFHEDNVPPVLRTRVIKEMKETFDKTSTLDAPCRMKQVVASTSHTLLEHLTTTSSAIAGSIPSFQTRLADRLTALLNTLRAAYLTGARGPAPAATSALMAERTGRVYGFVRGDLGVGMHGAENLGGFEGQGGVGEGEMALGGQSIGGNISRIYEVKIFRLNSSVGQLLIRSLRLSATESFRPSSLVCFEACMEVCDTPTPSTTATERYKLAFTYLSHLDIRPTFCGRTQ
jgi:phenylalanine ammonia-lyase